MENKLITAILDTVKEELELHSTPSAYRVYVFVIIENGYPVFNDTFIPIPLFESMKENNIIELVGTTKHQLEKCYKYKFTDFKYPKKILYNHRTTYINNNNSKNTGL